VSVILGFVEAGDMGHRSAGRFKKLDVGDKE
jgi:hypothetical protein